METLTLENEPKLDRMLEHAEMLQDFIDEYEVPKDVVTDEVLHVGMQMLEALYEKYGDPASESYRPYHNDRHAMNVLARSWMLLTLHRRLFPEKFQDSDYALIMFAALGHDMVHGTGGSMGEDERQSAALTCEFMKQSGFNDEACDRVTRIIEATIVETEDGSVVQANIRKGDMDPLRLILATADINGIAMEGSGTMIDDSVDLCMEFNKLSVHDLIETPKKLDSFLVRQTAFVEKRLEVLYGDFEHYYSVDETSRLVEAYEAAFTQATRDAIGVAQIINRFRYNRQHRIQEAVTIAQAHVGSDAEKLMVIKSVLKKEFHRLTPDEALTQSESDWPF